MRGADVQAQTAPHSLLAAMCCSKNCRLQVFNTAGKHVATIENDSFVQPLSVAVSPTKDTLFVTDNDFDRVRVSMLSVRGMRRLDCWSAVDLCISRPMTRKHACVHTAAWRPSSARPCLRCCRR